MKMWLDDELDPTNPYIKEMKGSDGTEHWVRTVEDAKTLLATGKVTEMSLHHDLGYGQLSGYDLVKWIEEQVFSNKWIGEFPTFRVHSDNPSGRKYMLAGLKAARVAWEKLNPETLFRGVIANESF